MRGKEGEICMLPHAPVLHRNSGAKAGTIQSAQLEEMFTMTQTGIYPERNTAIQKLLTSYATGA